MKVHRIEFGFREWLNHVISTARVGALRTLSELLLFPLFAAGIAVTAQDLPQAGQESTVRVPLSPVAVLVYLPINYTSERSWPTIFFYPPLKSGPTLQLLKSYCEGRDFVLVGMSYLEPEIPAASVHQTEEYWQRERTNFLRVLGWLSGRLRVDPRRVYIGGLIKGAWAAARIGELELDRVAGMMLLLSARQRTAPQPSAVALRGKPIYIGIGETDPSVLAALQTAEFYRRNGAQVTLEQYWGVGHAVPPDATLLKAWLTAEGPCKSVPSPETLNGLQDAVRKEHAAAQAEAEPLRRYRRLADLANNPLLPFLPQAFVAEVLQSAKRAREELPGREEWLAERSFFALLWWEMNVRRLEDLRAVRDGLRNTASTYAQTRFGRLAAEAAEKVAEAYERSLVHSRERGGTKEVKTGSPAPQWQFPSSDTKSVKVPKRVGNKVIFE